MKMDKNIDSKGGDSGDPGYEGVDNPRNDAQQDLDDILDMFVNRISDDLLTNGLPDIIQSTPPSLMQLLQQGGPMSNGRISDVDGIDPSSPLGRSLQIKFSELEEISRRLKTRLNQVVCDGEILLSPDAEATVNDTDLEWDLNTDSHAEDVSPQEFSQLVRMAGASNGVQSSDKSDDISK